MRRVALVSDMHGNAVGLDAALGDIAQRGVDEIVSLGDVAQGGPQPAECVRRLRELGCRCVLGNSDEFVLTLDHGEEQLSEDELERLRSVGHWSQERLGADGLAFLAAFEPIVEVAVDGERLVCCHGSPRSNGEVVLPETPRDEVRALIGDATAVVGGHVHLQWSIRLGEKLWCCAGSVGLVSEDKEPVDEEPFYPAAEYAIATLGRDGVELELRRVPYDVEAVRAATFASGMPGRPLRGAVEGGLVVRLPLLPRRHDMKDAS